MGTRGFVDRNRNTEYVSAKIFGDERIKKVKTYCNKNNINTRVFLEKLVDDFFMQEQNALMALSKEELVNMLLMKEGN